MGSAPLAEPQNTQTLLISAFVAAGTDILGSVVAISSVSMRKDTKQKCNNLLVIYALFFSQDSLSFGLV
jgi:hypothetical protein